MAAPIVPASKRCSKCGVEKPIAGFYRRSSSRGGLHAECRDCSHARNRESRARRRPADPPHVIPPDPYSADPLGPLYVVFRPLPDYPGYALDSDGNVWSRRKRGLGVGRLYPEWRRLKPVPTRHGYFNVTLQRDFESHVLRLNVLVATTFLGSRPDGMECLHINGIKADNRLSNLRWGTHLENCRDRDRHGATARGERLGVACEAVGAEVGAFALSGAGSHYDRTAGERNRDLVDGGAAFAVVVHKYLRASRSTADLVRRCVAAGIAVYLVDADGAEPRRIWGA